MRLVQTFSSLCLCLVTSGTWLPEMQGRGDDAGFQAVQTVGRKICPVSLLPRRSLHPLKVRPSKLELVLGRLLHHAHLRPVSLV
jgi:hypothetical protein